MSAVDLNESGSVTDADVLNVSVEHKQYLNSNIVPCLNMTSTVIKKKCALYVFEITMKELFNLIPV